MAKQGLSEIPGGRVLRVIGHFVLSLSRRCFGASAGNWFCRNTKDQRWPLHCAFRPLLGLSLFWLRQEATGHHTEIYERGRSLGGEAFGGEPPVRRRFFDVGR